MSVAPKSNSSPDYGGRIALKLIQFIVSVYLIFALYNIGPHWILLVACLAIPIYGIYLLLKSPEGTLKHPRPYIRYEALMKTKSWLRMDLSICLTMAVVCFCFGIVILVGFFIEWNSFNGFLLQAASAALLLGILYAFNAFLTLRQLQSGTVDFTGFISTEGGPPRAFATRMSGRSPLAVDTRMPGRTTMFHAINYDANNRSPRLRSEEAAEEEEQCSTERMVETRQSMWSPPQQSSTYSSEHAGNRLIQSPAQKRILMEQEHHFLPVKTSSRFPTVREEGVRTTTESEHRWSRETFKRCFAMSDEENEGNASGSDLPKETQKKLMDGPRKIKNIKEAEELDVLDTQLKQQKRPTAKLIKEIDVKSKVVKEHNIKSLSFQERGVDVEGVQEMGIDYCVVRSNIPSSIELQREQKQKSNSREQNYHVTSPSNFVQRQEETHFSKKLNEKREKETGNKNSAKVVKSAESSRAQRKQKIKTAGGDSAHSIKVNQVRGTNSATTTTDDSFSPIEAVAEEHHHPTTSSLAHQPNKNPMSKDLAPQEDAGSRWRNLMVSPVKIKPWVTTISELDNESKTSQKETERSYWTKEPLYRQQKIDNGKVGNWHY